MTRVFELPKSHYTSNEQTVTIMTVSILHLLLFNVIWERKSGQWCARPTSLRTFHPLVIFSTTPSSKKFSSQLSARAAASKSSFPLAPLPLLTTQAPASIPWDCNTCFSLLRVDTVIQCLTLFVPILICEERTSMNVFGTFAASALSGNSSDRLQTHASRR